MNTKQTEALKLALAFIEDTEKYLPHVYDASGLAVHAAIREALAEQPEQQQIPRAAHGDWGAKRKPQPAQQQEPVAFIRSDRHGDVALEWDKDEELEGGLYSYEPLYTSPPASKPWVGLTQDELSMIGDRMRTWNSHSLVDVYAAIEAKLREKNA